MIQRLAVLRVLVFGYACSWTIVRSPHLVDLSDLESVRLDAVGALWFLTGPVPDTVLVVAIVLTPLAAGFAAAGWRYRITAPLASIGFLFLTTYRNSWGQIFHTENLAAMHAIVLSLVPVAAAVWSLDSRRGSGQVCTEDCDDGRWAITAMAVLTTGTYFVAGIAKLRISGWSWVDGDTLLHQVTFDNVRKDLLGDHSSPLAAWFVGQPWLMAPSAWLTMVAELGAPFALLHQTVGKAWATIVVGFHVGVLALMLILFPYHLIGLGVAPLVAVENIPRRLARTSVGRAWTSRYPPASLISPGPG